MLLIGHSINSLLKQLKPMIKHGTILHDICNAAFHLGPITWSSQYPDLDPGLLKESKPWQGKYKGWIGSTMYLVFWTLRMLMISEPLNIYYSIAFIPYSDTDTNCAVCGALMGSLLGRNKLLTSKTLNSYWDMMLASDTAKGDYPRPEYYHPRQIIPTMEKLLKKFNI